MLKKNIKKKTKTKHEKNKSTNNLIFTYQSLSHRLRDVTPLPTKLGSVTQHAPLRSFQHVLVQAVHETQLPSDLQRHLPAGYGVQYATASHLRFEHAYGCTSPYATLSGSPVTNLNMQNKVSSKNS